MTSSNSTPRSKHWQLAPLDVSDGALQGFDDIEQSIFIVLSTRKGTDATRPEFGSNHFDYIDTPEDVFVPNAVREVVLAVHTWEKRATVDKVEFSGSAPEIGMAVHWHATADADGSIYTTFVPVRSAWSPT